MIFKLEQPHAAAPDPRGHAVCIPRDLPLLRGTTAFPSANLQQASAAGACTTGSGLSNPSLHLAPVFLFFRASSQ